MKSAITFIFGTLVAAMATVSWSKAPRRTQRQPAKSAPVMDDLHRLTSAAYRDHVTHISDKFAPETVDSRLAGKAFRFVVPFSNGDILNGTGGSPFYSYKNGQLLLTLLTGETEVGRHPIVVGREHTLDVSSYVGQNAFGATARVTSRLTLAQGIAIIDGPMGEKDPEYRWSNSNNFDYRYQARLAGPDAKHLALDADLVIDGTFINLDNGKLADCKTLAGDATIDRPTEFVEVECFVGARVSRVAFVRRSSGDVIRAWADDSSSEPVFIAPAPPQSNQPRR